MPIKPPLLLRRRRRGRRGRLLLQRQMKPLMPPILLGMARINPIELDAELQPPDRQMRELARAGRRKRRARCPCAAPAATHSPETCAQTTAAPRARSGATIRQHNTNRLHASATVSGSHRVRSAVRNQPLKSAVQTSFGACAAAKRLRQRHDIARAATRLTHALRGATDRPSCSPPATRAAAAARSGSARSFFGPQCGCRRRSARIAAADRVGHRPAVRVRRPRSLHQPMLPDPPRTGRPICRPSSD